MNFTTRGGGRAALLRVFLGGVVLAAGVLSTRSSPGGHGGALEMTALDVGQGDAILVRAPSGDELLVDAGPDELVLDALLDALPPGDRSLSVVAISHSDADHIGGMPSVLERYRVDGVVRTGAPKDTAMRAEVDRLAAGIPDHRLFAGDVVELDPVNGVRAEVLWPPRAKVEASSSDDNDLSLVLRVSYGSTSMLLTGDVGTSVEDELIRCQSKRIDVDLLKVGHHGSDTSTSERFLAAVSPSMAVISAGEGNRYGHPTPGVMARLASSTAAGSVHITKDEGSVAFVFDGVSVTRK